jgi:predicted ester cyclase
MSTAERIEGAGPEQLLRELVRCWNAGDLDGYAACFSLDLEGWDANRLIRGRDAVVAMARAMRAALPDSTMTINRVLVGGRSIAAEVTLRGTLTADFVHPGGTLVASGRRLELPVAAFLDVDVEGRFAAARQYFDTAEFVRQLRDVGVLADKR